ncbi:MAG: hypothetical protein GY950_00700 [bacterium]|nr:hypothetical protein [bacterium]
MIEVILRDSEQAAVSIIMELDNLIERLESMARESDDSASEVSHEAAQRCLQLLRFYVYSVAEGKRRLMEAYESFEKLAPVSISNNGD